MPRLIVAMVIHNEEQYIAKTIEDLLKKIKDVDVIEVLDGAWKHGGKSPNSTDKTKEIVEKLTNTHHNRCDIIFRETNSLFENEAAKRNYQLELIEETYGYEPYWVFVLDADEIVKFPNGLHEMWLKDYLGNLPFIGCVKAFAYGDKKPMIGPRLFPGGHGIHYHTNRSMIVHTGDHSIEIDYNLANQTNLQNVIPMMQVFVMQDMFLVNFWPTRDKQRMMQKLEYCKYQEETEVIENKPCDYQQKIKGLDVVE